MPNTNAGLGFVTSPRVLLIEDDPDMGETLVGVLERAGMQTAWARTGAEAVTLKASFKPDVVLVDLNLPDTDGIALVAWLAKRGECGVIVVSGLGEDSDRIVGLELGADDYIAKPPHLREMLARIRAVHRRITTRLAPAADIVVPKAVTVGPISIDISHRSVHTTQGERISLTGAEFTALETMLAANGMPVSRDTLCQAALHRPWRVEDRSVDQLIFNLRQKLPGQGERNRLIHSIRGAGYLLAAGHASTPAQAVA